MQHLSIGNNCLSRFHVAFTLIELLVVITIIVVLLSLLTPALDKAIYKAELTVCAGQQKAITTAVLAYAYEFGRHYPYRRGVREFGGNPEIIKLGQQHVTSVSNVDTFDERIPIDPYLDINSAFNDPLSEPVDLEIDDPDTTIWVSYWMRYGWIWKDFAGSGGMFKVGDRFSFEQNAAFYGTAKRFRFNFLIQDRDSFITGSSARGNHGDGDGVMTNYVFHNEFVDTDNGPQGQAIELANGKTTWSDWIGRTHLRGQFDMNNGYDDGSVSLTPDVPNSPDVYFDERFTFVPYSTGPFLWPAFRARTPVR